MKIVRYSIIFCLLFLASCSQPSGPSISTKSRPPDVKETLMLEPDADIFQWDGGVYQANVEWVQEWELTKKERIGEILHQVQDAEDFQDGTANVLPVGTVLYSTNEGGLYVLADVDGKWIKYVLLAEG